MSLRGNGFKSIKNKCVFGYTILYNNMTPITSEQYLLQHTVTFQEYPHENQPQITLYEIQISTL